MTPKFKEGDEVVPTDKLEPAKRPSTPKIMTIRKIVYSRRDFVYSCGRTFAYREHELEHASKLAKALS